MFNLKAFLILCVAAIALKYGYYYKDTASPKTDVEIPSIEDVKGNFSSDFFPLKDLGGVEAGNHTTSFIHGMT